MLWLDDVVNKIRTFSFTSDNSNSTPIREIDLRVKDQIIANLGNFGLNRKEFDEMEDFYVKQKLDLITEPKYIKGKSLTPPLARSLVYFPEGLQKGFYILLKNHGGV